jgi:hypothetical protein
MRTISSLSRRARVILGAAAVVLLALIALFFFTTTRSRAAPQQPLAFDHEAMVQQGITCTFCHTEAQRSPMAGMPSMQKCMGCHTVIDADKPEVKKLADYWQRKEPIPWVRVNRLPRFVYFSHQAHIAAGFNCERCHGDVGHMSVTQPVVAMNMGWCLSCHNQQPNAGQLRDCIVCHQ